jgi:ribA/ribD-fused uncharacterized protein
MKPKDVTITDDFVFFWNGIYSQWYPSKFIIAGITYGSCEQYMMAQKALHFKDMEAYEAIMASTNPKEQKVLGRGVKNFDTKSWNSVCREFVYQGNLAKFSQLPHFKSSLLATEDREIVEASPYDAVWGIALGEDKEKTANQIMESKKYFKIWGNGNLKYVWNKKGDY